MYDHRWDNLVKRIIGEANHRNGKTKEAIVRVDVSVVVQLNSPLLWEVNNATKVEPAKDVIESLAGISDALKQLTAKCDSPDRINWALREAIDKL